MTGTQRRVDEEPGILAARLVGSGNVQRRGEARLGVLDHVDTADLVAARRVLQFPPRRQDQGPSHAASPGQIPLSEIGAAQQALPAQPDRAPVAVVSEDAAGELVPRRGPVLIRVAGLVVDHAADLQTEALPRLRRQLPLPQRRKGNLHLHGPVALLDAGRRCPVGRRVPGELLLPISLGIGQIGAHALAIDQQLEVGLVLRIDEELDGVVAPDRTVALHRHGRELARVGVVALGAQVQRLGRESRPHHRLCRRWRARAGDEKRREGLRRLPRRVVQPAVQNRRFADEADGLGGLASDAACQRCEKDECDEKAEGSSSAFVHCVVSHWHFQDGFCPRPLRAKRE